MLDGVSSEYRGLMPEPSAPLPVAEMIIGGSVEDAAALLPRLFNLCRAAQAAAARMAFGLPLSDQSEQDLTREVLRDHLIKFYLKWPGLFGHAPRPLPADWATGGDALRQDLFGPSGKMPGRFSELSAFLASEQGIAGVLCHIDQCFSPGEAVTSALAPPSAANLLDARALENSVAARHATHPVMQAVAAAKGRGPFWRALARAYDLEACLDGALPRPLAPRKGTAIVPATRGAYAVTARIAGGIVSDFARVTPTDHLLATGGILRQTLATLPAEKSGLAPLILEILDPCTPVRLREMDHA